MTAKVSKARFVTPSLQKESTNSLFSFFSALYSAYLRRTEKPNRSLLPTANATAFRTFLQCATCSCHRTIDLTAAACLIQATAFIVLCCLSRWSSEM